MSKYYISAQELLEDSFLLGKQIIESGFHPTHIIGVWRGGTPVAIAVQELLRYCGLNTDHIAVRTSSYTGIESQCKEVKVDGLEYLLEHMNHDDRLLIVDDVFDSGRSVDATIKELQRQARRNTPAEIRIATPWYKPNKNATSRVPDYFIKETDQWLVFPHELDGLTDTEVHQGKGNVAAIINSIQFPSNA